MSRRFPHSRHRGHRRRKAGRLRRYGAAAIGIVLMAAAVAAWIWWDHGSQRTADAFAVSGQASPATRVLVRLPEDDAPHQNYIEWWYYNSHLRAADGREFSFHYVFFLVNSVFSYTVAQTSLTDHQTGKHYTAQKETAGNPSAGTVRAFDFVLGDWVMAGSDGRDTLKVATADFAFDLRLTNVGPTVFQGGTGLLDFGQAGSSYYYSRPRMNVEGKLKFGTRSVPVTGVSWFDHQWGDFQTGALGWDWFALQLDDGADVMLYRLRDRHDTPVLYSGTYTRNGVTEVLTESDFNAESTASWRSKRTGISYATAWRVRIPRYTIDLKITPISQDCEMDARTTTYNTYWEGAVRLNGSHGGRGFLEVSPGGPSRPQAAADRRAGNRDGSKP